MAFVPVDKVRLGPRQFGGDQFEHHSGLPFYAFFVTFTDSRIG